MTAELPTPEEIAKAQSEPGVFNLIERLQNRNMPQEDVTVYLDEELGWEYMKLRLAIHEAKTDAEVKPLESKLAEIEAKLAEVAYVFHLSGMSNEAHDEIVDEVEATHPLAYDETLNPLTGRKDKVEIENEARDALYNTLFLARAIASVTDPTGAVDADITPEKVVFIKRLAPLDAIRRITMTATRMRMAAEWMESIQSEDFSQRS